MALADILKQNQIRLQKAEASYLRAVEHVRSGDYLVEQVEALDKIDGLVPHKATSEGEALWILGKLRQVLDDAKRPEVLITEYESLKSSTADIARGLKS